MSRTKSSMKNFFWAMIGQGSGIIISFIARIIFIKTLGEEYLGLNGLFTNILTMLSLAELGIGTAITYSLYKPLAENSIRECKMLIQLYKKVYTVIGLVILILGISITPLLPFLIKDMPSIDNINLIYILFVINTSVSYFFSYKRNLIIADQNRYIATIYRYTFYDILNIFQIIYLILTKNYIGYLVLQVLFTIIENILISNKADKMYPYLKEKEKIKLNKRVKNDIIKNTKAMLMHKIGGIVVTSTDNLILSSFVSIVAVGMYSNYYLIINAINTITAQIYNSLTASIGNLCAIESREKQFEIFNKINFMTYWLFCFISICLLCLFNPFIEIWVGKKFLFGMDIVLILVINVYISGMRKSVLTFREASGLFYKDRWKAIVEALINLVASVILVQKLGVIGVFIGTSISSILTCVWIEPYVLYKYEFKKKVSIYFKDYLKKLVLTVFMAFIIYFICSFITGNIYFVFIIKLFICLIVPNVVMLIIFHNTDEFKYFYGKAIELIRKLKLNKLLSKESM